MERNERYARHYTLPGFGEKGQNKLSNAKVLIIGAGGLGVPALQYLAAAGVGTIGIVDHDHIELSNLQRQVLYSTEEIGLAKATTASKKMSQLNPDITIIPYVFQLTVENAINLIKGFDMILDCTDNFTTRYLLSDACRLLEKPLVFGAIYQYEGQLAVFNVADEVGIKTTYRHLFPTPPDPLYAPDCNDAGVLGVLPGIIGTMQAAETIKHLTAIGQILNNKLMSINLLSYQTLLLDIPHTLPKGSAYPMSITEFEATDYAYLCGVRSTEIQAIQPETFKQLYQQQDVLILDVRNQDELPKLNLPHIQIPLPSLTGQLHLLDKPHIVIVCQSGIRSLKAASILQEKIGDNHQISHLKGGVNALEKHKHE